MERKNESARERHQEPPITEKDPSSDSQAHRSTPDPKSGHKTKTPKYMKNASVRLLTHPVDKNIAWSFLVSVIFAAIAIMTGFPTVVLLVWILAVAMAFRILLAGCCLNRRTRRRGTPEDAEAAQQEQDDGGGAAAGCWRPDSFVQPPEALWLHDTSFNVHVAHCLFFLDPGLTVSKLQDMVRMRVLNKTTEAGEKAFPRFLQKVVPVCSGYCWTNDEDFSLENHIYDEPKAITTTQDLEDHVSDLMAQPLPTARPLWEIRLIRDFGRARDTVLLIRVHQAVSDAISLVIILGNYLSDNQQLLRLKSRFGSATFLLNVFRSLFVAPLTFLGWLVFRPRDYNFFSRRQRPQSRGVAWSGDIRFSKVLRIKQVMRCSLNDVFVSAASGAMRGYFAQNGIINPPNVTLSIPVDLRHDTRNATDIPGMGCRYSQVSVRLPSNTEGAIPRLWEVRRRMEELKTSPDTVVMYGAVHCLLPVLPEVVARWILNTVLRKATVLLSNVPGPEEPLTLGCRQLRKIAFWMSPGPAEVPVAFSVISYAGTVQLAVSADRAVVTRPQDLVSGFVNELTRLSRLLARRRIPGEHRRRSNFTEERRLVEIINPPDGKLQQKLYAVQDEIHEVTQRLTQAGEAGASPTAIRPCEPSEARLLQRLEELKEEFSELMSELRRRKSIADGILPDNQDEDMDGELRRPRRRTQSGADRRSSSALLSLASTTRPLATPTTSHHNFVVSTPNLGEAAGSPTNTQQRSSFLQVAQERFGRRKSDFN